MHWFIKGILNKYPSTLYISLNKVKFSEADMVSEHDQQELISSNSSSQNEINSDLIGSSQETFQV